jgi:hypothetical protein
MTAELCARHNLPIYPQWAGYTLPYFDLKGTATEFFRYKFLQRQAANGFAALAVPAKPAPKYGQPKNSGCHAYLPPLLTCPWLEVAKSPGIDMVITEGEKKAACGSALGIPTLGLGGVWNFTSSAAGQELIPDLEQFNWLDRNVVVCFDSDVKFKPEVNAALNRLAAVLTNRGAAVSVVYIPTKDKDAKQGLDDYLLAVEEKDKKAAYLDLLSRAEQVESGAILRRLKATVAFVKATNEIVTLDTGVVQGHSKFLQAGYRNWTYTVQTLRKEGGVAMTKKYAASDFLEDSYRTEVDRLDYAPQCPRGMTELDGARIYNTWPGWGRTPSKLGNIKPWDELFEFVLQDATASERLWLRRWFAYPLRYPGTKLHSAVLIWGAQGTGKTLLGESVSWIYGVDTNFRKVKSKDLFKNFNEWQKNKQFILGDEISVDGDKRAEGDNLKDMITGRNITIDTKFNAVYTVRDCINYYFTSNHSNAILLEDDDRRFFVQETPRYKREQSFYDNCSAWLEHGGGSERLFYYLTEELDMGDFNPRADPPVTASKMRMIMDGKSDLALKVAEFKQQCDAGQAPYTLATAQEILVRLYGRDEKGVKANGLSRAMVAAGFARAYRGMPVQVEGYGGLRLFVLRQGSKNWNTATRAEIEKTYRAEHDFKVGGKNHNPNFKGSVQ